MNEVDRNRGAQAVVRTYATQASGKGAAPAGETMAAAVVEVSQSTQELQRVAKLAQTYPDIRADAVESLKTKIDSSTYAVTGFEVADRIIEQADAARIR